MEPPAPDTTVPLPVKTVAATAAESLGPVSRDRSVEIDEATFTRNLNGWRAPLYRVGMPRSNRGRHTSMGFRCPRSLGPSQTALLGKRGVS